MDQARALARDTFASLLDRPGVAAFWWPRFEQALEWFIADEQAWREIADVAALEAEGDITLPLARPFTLRARADRIDRLSGDGYAVIDYKTGAVPSKTQVDIGLAPQLPLEAIMIERGGFKDLPAGPVSALRYVRVKGGTPPGEAILPAPIGEETHALIAKTYSGLMQLLERFDDPQTPYLSRPRPMFESAYGDYDHLARVKEWSAAGPDEGMDA